MLLEIVVELSNRYDCLLDSFEVLKLFDCVDGSTVV